MNPVSKRVRYARMNATIPSTESAVTMKRDQQPVVALYHRCPGAAAIVSSITARISRTKRSRLKRLGVPPDALGIPRRLGGPAQAVGKRLFAGLDQNPGFAIDHGFERAAAAERHDRPAAGLRLERHDPEILFAGKYRRD